MALVIDTSKALRRPSDLEQLAVAVRDADPNDETHWIEWKSSLDLTTKHGWSKIASAILGFANREPARAERCCEGCAYMIVGIEPNNVEGVIPVDHAKLEQGLDPYLGGHSGPSWSPQYVTVDGKQVLVVTIEAPRQGDRMFPLRKTFQTSAGVTVPDGTVFVRHQAKTERATAADHDMLTARSTGAAATVDVPTDVTVEWVGEVPTVPACDAGIGCDEWVAQRRSELKVRPPVPKPKPTSSSTSPLATLMIQPTGALNLFEKRSWASYEAEVESYLTRCRKRWPHVVQSRYHSSDIGLIKMAVSNPSDRNLPAVEMKLTLPDSAWAFPESLDDVEFPKAPAKYGDGNTLEYDPAILTLGLNRSYIPSPISLPLYDVDDDGRTVTFRSFHLRPHQREVLSGIVVAVSPHHTEDTVTASWTVTSTAFNGVHRGAISFSVDGVITGADLLNEPEGDYYYYDDD